MNAGDAITPKMLKAGRMVLLKIGTMAIRKPDMVAREVFIAMMGAYEDTDAPE